MFQLDRLRELTRSTGFIHTLSSIILNESIFYSADQIKKRNRFDLISFNEIALLLSLMSEAPGDLTLPASAELERQTNAKEAWMSFIGTSPLFGESIEDLFTTGQHFVEPIFYSAGSGFWFDPLAAPGDTLAEQSSRYVAPLVDVG